MGQTPSAEQRGEGEGGHRSRYSFSHSSRHRPRRSHSVPSPNYEHSSYSALPKPKETSLYKAIRKRFLGGRHHFHGSNSPKLIGPTGSYVGSGRNPVSLMFHGGGVRGKAAKDHAKVFRELVSGWTTQDLHCLVVEYEAAAALRELTFRADSAHGHAGTLKEDLAALFEQQLCTDVTLIFEGQKFPVHSAFLRHRSGFFRELLANVHTGDEVVVKLPRKFAPISAGTFGLLLQYLYTGEISTEARAGVGNEIELILRLKEEFGCPHTLDYDAYAMLQQVNETGDAILVFVSNSNSTPLPPPSPGPQDPQGDSDGEVNEEDNNHTLRPGNRQSARVPQAAAGYDSEEEAEDGTVPAGDEMNIWRQGLQELPIDNRRSRPVSLASSGTPSHQKHCEFRCHSAILAARSPFFRSLIQKRLNERLSAGVRREETVWNSQAGTSTSSSPQTQPIQILLDESVIPRTYAPVLLHALYTDQVDLSQVIRGCPVSVNSLSEVQAIASGKCQVSPIDEATEIFQIARFLELEGLAQGCENIIAQHISAECLPSVFNWSVESYGSFFVRRHCVNFLCKEFSRIAASQLLFDLEETLLAETLRSDFVQASELEILQAVVKWGEHQLIRKLEEREPNLISGTTHSIARKGIRRADLSDEELRKILSRLMPLVRTDYILPPYHQALIQATSRGLVSCPPADLPGTTTRSTGSSSRAGTLGAPPGGYSIPPIVYSAADVGESSNIPHPDGHWLHPHSANSGPLAYRLTPRPRFFLPYFREARNQLEKRMADSPELKLLSHNSGFDHQGHFHAQYSAPGGHPMLGRHTSDVTSGGNFLPDTLYMVRNRSRRRLSAARPNGPIESLIQELEDGRGSFESVNIVGVSGDNEGLLEDEFPPPDYSVIDSIRQKIATYLRTSATVQKGLNCGCTYHRKAVLTQVCLRAIRESGCPDSTIRNLKTPSALYPTEERPISGQSFCDPGDLSSMYGRHPYDQRPPDESPAHGANRRFVSEPELGGEGVGGVGPLDLPSPYHPPPPEAWPDLMSSTNHLMRPSTSLAAEAELYMDDDEEEMLGEGAREGEGGTAGGPPPTLLHQTCEYVSWWSAQASASLSDAERSFENNASDPNSSNQKEQQEMTADDSTL